MTIKTPIKLSILLLFISLFIGLFLSAQWRTGPQRVLNPVLSYRELSETLNLLEKEQNNLKKQISELQKIITEDQESLKREKITSHPLLLELEKIKALLGLTPLQGKGVVITLADSQAEGTDIYSITHAADLRDVVNLLWAKGAEAISINEERIVTSTSIDCLVNTILVNDAKLTSPFIIQAIGKADLMKEALDDPQILTDLHRRKNLGLIFNLEIKEKVLIPAFDGSFKVGLAKIKK